MASVLNRTTKQYLASANTPDYSTTEWIINPDLSLVLTTPQQYWVIEGDLVRPANQEEQANIDKFAEFQGMSIDQIKEQLNLKINRVRDEYIDSGVIFKSHVFDSDQRARENITGVNAAIQNGLTLPEGFTWRSQNNENVSVTPMELAQLGVGLVLFVSSCYNVGWYHKDFLKNQTSTDPNFYIEYDFMVGWPNKSIDGSTL
jgi:hypothetical protein